jgi:hypothetical protein
MLQHVFIYQFYAKNSVNNYFQNIFRYSNFSCIISLYQTDLTNKRNVQCAVTFRNWGSPSVRILSGSNHFVKANMEESIKILHIESFHHSTPSLQLYLQGVLSNNNTNTSNTNGFKANTTDYIVSKLGGINFPFLYIQHKCESKTP